MSGNLFARLYNRNNRSAGAESNAGGDDPSRARRSATSLPPATTAQDTANANSDDNQLSLDTDTLDLGANLLLLDVTD